MFKGSQLQKQLAEFGAKSVTLAIQMENFPHATFVWSTNAVGWILETSTAIHPTNWIEFTNAPAMAGTNFSLGITTKNRQQFFRLVKP